MINLNANVNTILPNINQLPSQVNKAANGNANFAKTIDTIGQYISKVDYMQHCSDISIKDLLTGQNPDITTVVSAVAKADMSFKLLIGVRNKLIEAYKQTLNMPL